VTVTVDDLAGHLGFATTPADTEMLDRVLGTALAMIGPFLTPDVQDQISDGTLPPEQEHALDLATLTVGQDLWRRKDSVGGSYLFADGSDASAVLPRDQLRSIWPILCEAQLSNPVPVA
jgi:hypothetical protein